MWTSCTGFTWLQNKASALFRRYEFASSFQWAYYQLVLRTYYKPVTFLFRQLLWTLVHESPLIKHTPNLSFSLKSSPFDIAFKYSWEFSMKHQTSTTYCCARLIQYADLTFATMIRSCVLNIIKASRADAPAMFSEWSWPILIMSKRFVCAQSFRCWLRYDIESLCNPM